VYPNYKSSSNSEPNRRLFAVEGVGGHFVFFGQCIQARIHVGLFGLQFFAHCFCHRF